MYFIIFLLLVVSVSGDFKDKINECNKRKLDKCLEEDLAKAFRKLNGMPHNSFLETHCNDILRTIECFEEMEDGCPMIDLMKRPFQGSDVTVDRIKDMCSEGSGSDRIEAENYKCRSRKFACVKKDLEKDFRKFEGYPDDEFLKTYCDDILIMLDCFKETEDDCPISNYVGPFQGLEATTDFMKDMCSEDSAIRRKYKENAECIEKEYPRINRKLLNAVPSIAEFRHRGDKREVSFDSYICFMDMFERQLILTQWYSACGNDTGDFFSEMYLRIRGSVIDACSDNIYENEEIIKFAVSYLKRRDSVDSYFHGYRK